MSELIEITLETGIAPTSMVDILTMRAEQDPDRIAYIFLADGEREEITITYGEMHQRAKAIASMLQKEKDVFGQRCLLIYPPGIDFLTAFFGCLYAGVIAVPVYPPRKDKDISRILTVINNSGTTLVLTKTAIVSRFEKIRTNFAIAELDSLIWVASDDSDNIGVLADQWTKPDITSDHLAFLQYTSGSTGLPKGVMVSHRNLIYNEQMMAQSFGHSKESIVVTWLPFYHDMGLIGNVLHPLFLGFKCIFLSPEAFLQKPFRWLDAISRYKATTSGGAPNFAYDLCADRVTNEQKETLDLSHWKFALIGSDTIWKNTIERFTESFESCGFKRETFYPGYGLAEATVLVSGGNPQDPPKYLTIDAEALKQHRVVEADSKTTNPHELVGCGTTILDQKIKIVNPENKTECAEDQVGEVWISGINVARGYWGNEEATRQTFHARIADGSSDNYLRTGDLGFLKEGELYITGRIKNLIIIRGRNHYPQDIEATVESSAKALRAGCSAAFTIENGQEEQLVIVAEMERRFMPSRRGKGQKVPLDNRNNSDRRQFNEEDIGTATPDSNLILDEIVQNIRHSVSERHGLQIQAIVLVRPVSIPKTTSGKIKRFECKKQFLNNELITIHQWTTPASVSLKEENSYSTPHLSTEAIQSWLLSRLATELKLARHQIDLNTELYRYGLDSLGAITITGELEEWLEKPVSPTIFYNYPTIANLSAHLTGEPDNSAKIKSPNPDQLQLNVPVAIVGAACRFPGADNPEDFWNLLIDGVDAISEVPPDRWNSLKYFDSKQGAPGKMNTKWGGFLKEFDLFDPFFFGISPREATYMDPQQRILLEVSWEAFENAGINISNLSGSLTGVFIGISNNDYSRLSLDSGQELNVYQGTGNAISIAANRISYQYDLRGPSIAIDTACSSSLVSVHMACQSLRNGESRIALAGGVNLILSPETSIIFSQADMMAGDGRCKAFDESADGYVRSEGCGLVVLKLLPDAIEDGDEILAVIRGSAINQDGRSNGITAPNGPSQQAVISQALRMAEVQPSQVGYLEAHGTGTKLGDPIEMESIKAVLMQERPLDRICYVGSVKTNLGHLESAAGIAGLLKAALSVHHGTIPANLHFKKLNPHIRLEDMPFKIPVSNQTWSDRFERRYAGISSFGFGGTNTHLILENHHQREIEFKNELAVHLLTISAKSKETLLNLATKHLDCLNDITNDEKLGNYCFSANTGRSQFKHRLAIPATSVDHLKTSLKTFLNNPDTSKLMSDKASSIEPLRIQFFFPDQSNFYRRMGEILFKTQPEFNRWLVKCDTLLTPLLNTSIISLLYSDEDLINSHPEWVPAALLAVEISLARMWMKWGIVPDYLTGSGIGKLAAICIADVFNLETGLKLAVEYGLRSVKHSDQTSLKQTEEWLSHITLYHPSIPLILDQSDQSGDNIPDLQSILFASDNNDDTEIIKPVFGSHEIQLTIGPAVSKEISLSSLAKDNSDWGQIVSCLQKLYLQGIDIHWNEFYREYSYLRKVKLPNYPFQKKRYWIREAIPITPTAVTSDSLLYDFVWEPSELQENKFTSLEKRDGFWLILADPNDTGLKLAQILTKLENQCVLVKPGESFQQLSTNEFVLAPDRPDQFNQLVEETSAEFGSCLGVIHLWSLNLVSDTQITETHLTRSIELGCYATLHLINSLSRSNRLSGMGLWLVTADSQLINFDKSINLQLGHWPLWGFGKGIALEFPDIKVRLVDLNRDQVEENANLLLQEIQSSVSERQVAYLDGRRFVARMEKSKTEPVTSESQCWNEDGTFVITGGFGKLGLRTAEHLVDKGVRNLVLLSRRLLSDMENTDRDEFCIREILRTLERAGATIKTYQVDVSDFNKLKQVFADIERSMPPVKGILHCAGVVSKNSITGLTTQEIDTVMKSKVFGTWALHQISLSLNLDCFILYSSISSVWGSKGISHYSAANAFLDGMALYRKSLGLPVLSINWGPWIDGGMTSDEEQNQMARIGVFALDPDSAFNAMNELVMQNKHRGIVAAINWKKLEPLYRSIGYGNLFTNVIDASEHNVRYQPRGITTPTPQGDWIVKLDGMSLKNQAEHLTQMIITEIAKIMHCNVSDIDIEAGFFDMGMDSLMAVELKDVLEQQLALPLENTIVFDYPNIKSISRFLVDKLSGKGDTKTISGLDSTSLSPASKAPYQKDEPVTELKDIDSLSEDEISRLIEKELEDI